MNDKYFVIAGTKVEYDEFIRRKCAEMILTHPNESVSLSHFVYVDDIQKLYGQRDVHGWFVGTFRNRDDIKAIVRMVGWCNSIPEGEQIIPEWPLTK
jgi:hypothetical protein